MATFVMTIGTDGSKRPYKMKKPHPTVLIIRRLVMFFIKKETNTSADATYPMYSV